MDKYYTEDLPEYVMDLFPKDFKGICVDIGAYDPFWMSNSWIFEQAGWDVHCIEPNPNCIPGLKQYRKNVYEYACGDENKDDVEFLIYNDKGTESSWTGLIRHPQGEATLSQIIKVKVRTLDWLMENEIKRDVIDFLSIDVEESEITVLHGIDLDRWKPQVVVLESFGHTQAEQRAYMYAHGYKMVHRIVYNDIYVRKNENEMDN